MTLQTFTYAYFPDPVEEVEPRVLSAKYGDGYEQIAEDGINARLRKWTVNFVRRNTRSDEIKTFLDSYGLVGFYWTPPRGVQGVFICRRYTRTALDYNAWRISAVFEEAAGLE
jgi:phage-related protein